MIFFFFLVKELSSEDRFHVELHFSPGAKGCEEDKNLPSGFGYRPASREVKVLNNVSNTCISSQLVGCLQKW